ncbi:MAG: hypothetical protein IAC23_06690 [Bacteroidetes bacterium]|uniref:LamG-like jellyroll fold domain-containing protein n=1 Tax=Candidatus Cryptobacteroides merdavium TaxID=2840769 RepID=A0A9D9EDC3_9BACT|nr:hypothetical protein [Candidatus Cryptobacteroides merdavium]
MRRPIIILAAAALLLAGCKEETPETPVSGDEISIAPETAAFPENGGSQQVMITSSGEWTLTSDTEYDWITVDALSGEDGDIVTFEASENYTGEQLIAEFTFKCGTAEAVFTAVSESGEPLYLELVSASEMEIGHAASRLQVEVSTNLYYRTLTADFGTADWISANATIQADGGAILNFDVAENDGETNRETEIVISGEGCEPVSVKLVQRAEPVISPEKTEYFMSLDDTEVSIPVTANVDYEVEVTEGGDWLKYDSGTDGVEKFSMSTATSRRSAVVTFTETDPLEGVAPVVATVTVSQREAALVNYAIDMTDARIFPEEWNNPVPLQYMNALTIEALVRPDNFEKGGSGTLSTIMGIEGEFLVRVGDAGVPNNQIQIATSAGNYTNGDLMLNTGEWYHIAVTFDNAAHKLQCYINGELLLDEFTSFVSTVNFGVERGNETGSWGSVTRVFWIGYSYDPARDFEGLMTELRIWNRALTENEINDENHFYTVDPDSDGLVAYWKCNEGTGTTVEDYSASGNDLTGQYKLHQEGSGNNLYTTGDTAINWVEVSLP